MPSVEVVVTFNKLQHVAQRIRPVTDERINRVLDDIVTAAKGFAPVDTGYLRDHISRQDKTVISEADYSSYQEYGTRFQPGTPFMRPAVEAVKPTIPGRFARFGTEVLS